MNVMKKYLVLVFIVWSCLVSAQTYVPFPTENAEWHVARFSSPEYFQNVTESRLLKYTIGGDTIFNEIKYKTMYMTTNDQTKIVGFIREENRRIYYLGGDYIYSLYYVGKQLNQSLKECAPAQKAAAWNEVILYDFNLKVGDAVQASYYNNTVLSIDSVLIGNSYRKRYNLGYDVIVEGIGSITRGLLWSVTPIPSCGSSVNWEHICFSYNGETLYENPAFKDCNSTIKWSDRNYFKTNSQWYYGKTIYQVPFPFNSNIVSSDYYCLKSTADTIINGKNCQIINQFRGGPACYSYQFPVSMYQSNDTVYFYNTQSKSFSTLYVYAAKVGDSWTVKYPQGDVQVLVDSVSSIEALGEMCKVQHVTFKAISKDGNILTDYQPNYHSKIIQNIGDINDLFMSNIFSIPVCDEMVDYTGLRCYVHPDYGTYKTGTVACDFVSEITNPEIKSIKVYVASSSNLIIESELPAGYFTFELFDVQGSKLLSTEMNTAKSSIPFGDFSKGLYLYRLIDNGKMLKSGKIVKM